MIKFTPLKNTVPGDTHHTQTLGTGVYTISTPLQAARIMMQAVSQNIRYTLDGSTPSATSGLVLIAGDRPTYLSITHGMVLKFFREVSGAVLEYAWCGNMEGMNRRRMTAAMGGGGASKIILDNFTDTNGTLLSAHTIAPTNTPSASWSFPTTGTLAIQSNKALANYVSGGRPISVLDAGVSNCTISQAVRFANDDKRSGSILYRWGDTANLWYLELVGTITGIVVNKFRIVEITAGTTTVRASVDVTPVKDVDYVLSLALNGSSMIATLDGVNQITYSSAVRATATIHGLGCYTSNDASGVTFDDFKINL